MTTSADPFESTLRAALVVMPDPGKLARVDARIAAAIATVPVRRSSDLDASPLLGGTPWAPATARPTWHPSRALRLALLLGLTVALALGAAALVGTSPSPSPDPPNITNGLIAFATESGDSTRGGGSSDIYVVRMGGEPRLLAGGDATTHNVCPGFSPDGGQLAYGEGSGPSSETLEREHRAIVVVTLDADGSIVEPAIRLPMTGAGRVPCPVWSPDGLKLAYPDGDAIAIVWLGGASMVLPDWDPGRTWEPWEREFAWSPDGTTIAAVRPSGTWVLPIDGGEPRQLSSVPADLVSWSPDGSRIATQETVLLPWEKPQDKKRKARPHYVQARLFSADGQRGTIDLGRDTGSPLWSPSGDRLVYFGEDGPTIADADGSHATALDIDEYSWPLRWSPDGGSLLLMSEGGAAPLSLHSMSLDDEGGSMVLIADIPVSDAMSWPGRGDISWQRVLGPRTGEVPAPSASDSIDLATPPAASHGPAETSSTVRGWPESRSNPAGLYSWSPMDNGRLGSGLVTIRVDKLDDPDSHVCARYRQCPFTEYVLSQRGFDGPHSDVPTPISDEQGSDLGGLRRQLWYVDGGDLRVYVLLESYPDIEPADLAEAEGVVRSIHWEPSATGDGGRFVFALPDGWDSG